MHACLHTLEALLEANRQRDLYLQDDAHELRRRGDLPRGDRHRGLHPLDLVRRDHLPAHICCCLALSDVRYTTTGKPALRRRRRRAGAVRLRTDAYPRQRRGRDALERGGVAVLPPGVQQGGGLGHPRLFAYVADIDAQGVVPDNSTRTMANSLRCQKSSCTLLASRSARNSGLYPAAASKSSSSPFSFSSSRYCRASS